MEDWLHGMGELLLRGRSAISAASARASRMGPGGRGPRPVPRSGSHRLADGPARRIVGDPRRPEHGPADRQHGRGRLKLTPEETQLLDEASEPPAPASLRAAAASREEDSERLAGAQRELMQAWLCGSMPAAAC